MSGPTLFITNNCMLRSLPKWQFFFQIEQSYLKLFCVKFYDLAGFKTKFDAVICNIFDVIVLALFCLWPRENICTCQNITSVTFVFTSLLYQIKCPFCKFCIWIDFEIKIPKRCPTIKFDIETGMDFLYRLFSNKIKLQGSVFFQNFDILQKQ